MISKQIHPILKYLYLLFITCGTTKESFSATIEYIENHANLHFKVSHSHPSFNHEKVVISPSNHGAGKLVPNTHDNNKQSVKKYIETFFNFNDNDPEEFNQNNQKFSIKRLSEKEMENSFQAYESPESQDEIVASSRRNNSNKKLLELTKKFTNQQAGYDDLKNQVKKIEEKIRLIDEQYNKKKKQLSPIVKNQSRATNSLASQAEHHNPATLNTPANHSQPQKKKKNRTRRSRNRPKSSYPSHDSLPTLSEMKDKLDRLENTVSLLNNQLRDELAYRKEQRKESVESSKQVLELQKKNQQLRKKINSLVNQSKNQNKENKRLDNAVVALQNKFTKQVDKLNNDLAVNNSLLPRIQTIEKKLNTYQNDKARFQSPVIGGYGASKEWNNKDNMQEEFHDILLKKIETSHQVVKSYTDMELYKKEQEIKKIIQHNQLGIATAYSTILKIALHGEGFINTTKGIEHLKLAGFEKVQKLEKENQELKKEVQFLRKKMEIMMSDVAQLKNTQRISYLPNIPHKSSQQIIEDMSHFPLIFNPKHSKNRKKVDSKKGGFVS